MSPVTNIMAMAPVLTVCGLGVLVLLAETFATNRRFTGIAWLTIVALALTVFVASSAATSSGAVYGGAIALDAYTVFCVSLLGSLAVLAVLASIDYVPSCDIRNGEYYPLLLFAVAGCVVMVAATELIVMFLGLEIMSMAVYVLAGIRKRDPRSNEAALKYFLMGAFASAILLYGIALLYVASGTTILGEIAPALALGGGAGSDLALLGLGLVMVGFAFKVAAVPFHLWAPDVYEGSPTAITAFMATAVKAAGFAALARIVIVALPETAASLTPLVWGAAAVTMTVGNVVALRQTSVKRMLAYSSIAHTGYLLVGVTAGTPQAGAAVLYYLVAYGVMNIGAFGVLIALSKQNDSGSGEEYALAGLGRTQPVLAVAMSVCMLSLLGFPPLAGFVGKLSIFAAALDAGYSGLVLIAIVNSVVSAVYYLSVIRTMYFDDDGGVVLPSRPNALVAVAAAAVLTVGLGLAPASVMDAATGALGQVLLGP